MEKFSFLKKIDEIYTKATKAIIGDIPHDGDTQQDTSNHKTTSNKTTKAVGLKERLIEVKEKFLTLGTPNEKEVLYEEVVKREKQKSKKVTKTKQNIAKKSSAKKEKSSTSTTDTKKPETKKATKTKSPVSTAKKTTPTKQKNTTSKKTVNKKPKTKITTNTPKTSTKSTDITKKSSTKTDTTQKTIKKSPNTKTGGKRAEKIALYIKDIKKHYGEVDEEFVAIIVKNLGPSIYNKDAETVACSDPKELDTVRKNFLMKKLQIDASQGVLDAAIQDVCEELKKARTKYRATFYYALAKKFKKESTLS
jgi:hypothetical protein